MAVVSERMVARASFSIDPAKPTNMHDMLIVIMVPTMTTPHTSERHAPEVDSFVMCRYVSYILQQSSANVRKHMITTYTRNRTKNFMLRYPMQLFTHGQWWSMRTMHLLHWLQ